MKANPWSRADVLRAVALVAAVLLTYANVYRNSFVFDDEFLVQRNLFLDSFANLGRILTSSSTAGAGFRDSFYRPTQALAYLVVNQLFGREPWAFHALNVGAHAINALLVCRLGRKFGLDAAAAFAAALLWAVHPLHVEAITYVSATADPFHALFCLLALNLVPRHPLVGLAAFVAALLSKESAIVLPALILATLFITSPARWRWRTYAISLPFWVVAGAYFVLRRWVLGAAQTLAVAARADAYADHIFTRLWTALATLPEYLELIVWPHDLHMDREFPIHADPTAPAVLGGAAMIAVGLTIVWLAWRRRTAALTWAAGLIAWLAFAHAPHSGVLIAVNSVFLEHWMYLTALPVFWFAGAASARIPARAVRTAVIAGATIALAQKTWRQNEVWATPIGFFSHTLRYSPSSARIRHNLANALIDAGRVDEGLEQFELMIRAGTPYPATYHGAARVHLQRGRIDLAEPYYLKALALDPYFYPSVQDLISLYASKGDHARAAEYERRLKQLHP